ncbi:MAG TPA: hypothetical protein VIK53_09565 [Verrucomicrobiae bacterium]
MEFIKKHYEKILLGLVLAGLVGALVTLPFYISADKQKMEDLISGVTNPQHVQPLTNLDLSAGKSVLARLRAPYSLDFETRNKLFNPMRWEKSMDGTMIPAAGHTGPQVVVVTAIAPLDLVITLDSVVTNALGSRYVIGVAKQADPNPSNRIKRQHYVSPGDKNETFTLVAVKGPPENPDALMLKLADTGEEVPVSRDKPFRRTDAYVADFSYAPEKKVFRGRRNGDRVPFNGTDYIVDEVNSNELILMDPSNQKKTSLPFTP